MALRTKKNVELFLSLKNREAPAKENIFRAMKRSYYLSLLNSGKEKVIQEKDLHCLFFVLRKKYICDETRLC